MAAQQTEKNYQPSLQIEETPQNGIAGLKHWRHDIVAGLVVALVSIPLSLGIALASGAPPICGLTSEIIAGLIFPFLGGAFVTISGPAAGLAPVLYSSIAALGHGDMQLGYKMVTAVIIFAGITQLILMKLNAARFSYLIPRAAVQGMLASIGLLIIAKQIPYFIGHKYSAHEFFGLLAETPSHILHLNPAVFLISIICLALLFLTTGAKSRLPKWIPPHLLVVLVGIGLGQFLHLDGKFLVDIPANPLQHGFVFPDFAALFSNFSIMPTVVLSVLALTFVDGTESLATIHAVDGIDPYKRKSDPDRTLFAMGISNICSGFIGGLTIIPGIIKSSTCVFSGGKTAWVNMYNALFITAFLVFGHELLGLIPLGALSAVLVHIGYKLAGPQQWQKMIEQGSEQMLVFSTTVLFTVSSDLLIGVAAGIVIEVLILTFYSLKAADSFTHQAPTLSSMHAVVSGLFKNPVERIEEKEREVRIHFAGPLTCFNTLFVREALDEAQRKCDRVRIILGSNVRIIDHSSYAYLNQTLETVSIAGGRDLSIEGMDLLYTKSPSAESLRHAH